MNQSETIEKLAPDLVQALAEMPGIDKDGTGHGYKYATLDNIINRTRPVLAAHNLGIIQTPTNSDGDVMGLTTRLIHASGQWLEGTVYAPRDEGQRRNSVQAAGSTITYLRRYGIAALLGLVDETDNDGIAPVARRETPRAQPPAPNPSPLNGPLVPPEMSNGNGDDPQLQMPTDKAKKAFHATGVQTYGDEWDDKRPELVMAITHGRTRSSNDLSAAEMAKLTDGMNLKLKERETQKAVREMADPA